MALIPELEDLSKQSLNKRDWSEDDLDTLNRYYKKVPIEDLMKYLPGRTPGAIRVKVHELKNKKITEVTRG
jgi:hypothetical protein